jgi:hypothetical protein
MVQRLFVMRDDAQGFYGSEVVSHRAGVQQVQSAVLGVKIFETSWYNSMFKQKSFQCFLRRSVPQTFF